MRISSQILRPNNGTNKNITRTSIKADKILGKDQTRATLHGKILDGTTHAPKTKIGQTTQRRIQGAEVDGQRG